MRYVLARTMKTALPGLLIAFGVADAQNPACTLKVTAQLVNKDLNLKPVPKLRISAREQNSTRGHHLATGFDGNLEIQLPCGIYQITTDSATEFEGKQYAWDVKATLAPDAPFKLELSNDNATSSPVRVEAGAGRQKDSLSELFKQYQDSVVTVWSELGHGTGFFVDANGIVLTNQHVIGPSQYIAIQVDDDHKIPAVVLAADPEKDVAVLWANKSALPNIVVAPLAKATPGEPLAVEGERVFTIGSPLNQRKILTTGIVSKLETRAIISDVNINPGNSGGPLFNSLGYVIGLTTFAEPGGQIGPGISGIVRIEQVEETLNLARSKMAGSAPPPPTLLPVEPKLTFPLEAIKSALSTERFDPRPYLFQEGDYDMAIITPVFKYNAVARSEVEAAHEKAKRHRNTKAVQDTYRPLDALHNWAEYAGQYKSVIQIRASPKLRETFGSAIARGLTAQYGMTPAKMRFKADFYKMRLLCGGKEIEPIHPGKIAKVVNIRNAFINATDASYEGLYTYPPDSISPSCGGVSVEIYSEKDPGSARLKTLKDKTIDRVWSDLEPYRALGAPAQSAKASQAEANATPPLMPSSAPVTPSSAPVTPTVAPAPSNPVVGGIVDITFTSTPANALVSIGGMALGRTPFTTKIPLGYYKATFSVYGYANSIESLSVGNGYPTTVNAMLQANSTQ
jgi:S1-C subfamily serine protease